MMYRVEYEDGSPAGFTYEGRFLWKGGSCWSEATFGTKKEAEEAIKETNLYRKMNGWLYNKFKIIKCSPSEQKEKQ